MNEYQICRFGHVFMSDTGTSVGEISGQAKPLNAVDFRPARPFRVLTASEDNTVAVFEGPPFKFKCTKQVYFTFNSPTSNIQWMGVSKPIWIAIGTHKNIQMWNSENGAMFHPPWVSNYRPAHFCYMCLRERGRGYNGSALQLYLWVFFFPMEKKVNGSVMKRLIELQDCEISFSAINCYTAVTNVLYLYL